MVAVPNCCLEGLDEFQSEQAETKNVRPPLIKTAPQITLQILHQFEGQILTASAVYIMREHVLFELERDVLSPRINFKEYWYALFHPAQFCSRRD